jgi:hypothetical protein
MRDAMMDVGGDVAEMQRRTPIPDGQDVRLLPLCLRNV